MNTNAFLIVFKSSWHIGIYQKWIETSLRIERKYHDAGLSYTVRYLRALLESQEAQTEIGPFLTEWLLLESLA